MTRIDVRVPEGAMGVTGAEIKIQIAGAAAPMDRAAGIYIATPRKIIADGVAEVAAE